MLEFKKIEDDGNVATFEYYPEGKGEPGTVVLDRSVGIVSVLSVSPNDRHGRYAEHMFERLAACCAMVAYGMGAPFSGTS